VKRKTVSELGGEALLKHYASLRKALRAIYPDFAWESDKFAGHWLKKQKAMKALEWAGKTRHQTGNLFFYQFCISF